MIRKIKRNIKEQEVRKLPLYTTLMGSITTTFAILHEKDENWAWKAFKELEKADWSKQEWTVKSVVDYIWEEYEGNEDFKQLLILLTDIDNIRSPLVTFAAVEDNQVFAMPLHKDGIAYGLIGLYNEGRDNVQCEFIYGEE